MLWKDKIFICQNCGKEFTRKNACENNKPKFCSRECNAVYRAKKPMICENCGISFYSNDGHSNRKNCSVKCKAEQQKINPSQKKGKKYPNTQRARTAECKVCGKEFRALNDHNGKCGGETERAQIYCSKECWNKRRVLKICEHCGKEIISYGGKRFCSRECAFKAMIGEKAAQWKDGKSLLRDRARLSPQLKIWRLAVYKRDNHTCQQCGAKGMIHAHHKIEWAQDESQRFIISNGITLCVDCHGKIHGVDFTKRGKNKCSDCGKDIQRQSKRCRKCYTINQLEINGEKII